MRTQSYTNTGSPKAIAGLLFVTFAMAAIMLYTPEIVQGIVTLTKTGKVKTEALLRDVKKKGEGLLHKGEKSYAVCERTYDGRIFDTGKRIWR
jgi:hypothetical protein